MKQSKQPFNRSDYPPDAEVFLPQWEENHTALILFGVFMAVWCGVAAMVLNSGAGLAAAVGFWVLVMGLMLAYTRGAAQSYLVLHGEEVEFRGGSKRVTRFTWDEVTAYRRFSTRSGVYLKLYLRDRTFIVQPSVPGQKQLLEQVRRRAIPPQFPRGWNERHFWIGPLLGVEGDDLVRVSLLGRRTLPLSEVRIEKPLFRIHLNDSSGKTFAALGILFKENSCDRLKWALERHGVYTDLF